MLLKIYVARPRIIDTHNCFEKLNFLETVQYLKYGFQEEGQKNVVDSCGKSEIRAMECEIEVQRWTPGFCFVHSIAGTIATTNYMVLGLNFIPEDFNKTISPLLL